jgi:hypothetical protein
LPSIFWNRSLKLKLSFFGFAKNLIEVRNKIAIFVFVMDLWNNFNWKNSNRSNFVGYDLKKLINCLIKISSCNHLSVLWESLLTYDEIVHEDFDRLPHLYVMLIFSHITVVRIGINSIKKNLNKNSNNTLFLFVSWVPLNFCKIRILINEKTTKIEVSIKTK